MKKPELKDYYVVSNSTTTSANYNYKAYSLDMANYCTYLERQVKKFDIQPISASWVNNNYKSPKARDFYKTINSDLKDQDTYFDGNCWLINPLNQRPVFMWKPNLT